MHRVPKLAAALHVQPEVGTVAEHAGKNQGRRGSDVAPVVAQLANMRVGLSCSRSPVAVVVQIDVLRFPRLLSHRKPSRHCLLTRFEWKPAWFRDDRSGPSRTALQSLREAAPNERLTTSEQAALVALAKSMVAAYGRRK